MYDVIVIGIGAMGSSACYHVARRGAKVLGLDQHSIPNNLGSSHGESRMIRMAYYEHPDYVPLLLRGYELWHELERDSNQKLLHETGGLYMSTRDGQVLSGSLQSARLHNLDHDLLNPRQLRDRYPQFPIPEDHYALHVKLPGLLLPENLHAA